MSIEPSMALPNSLFDCEMIGPRQEGFMSDERRLKAFGRRNELTKSLFYHPLLKAQSEWPWPTSPFDDSALISALVKVTVSRLAPWFYDNTPLDR